MDAWQVASFTFSGITALGIGVLLCQVFILKKQNRLNAFSSLFKEWGSEEEGKRRKHVFIEFQFNSGDELATLNWDSRRKVEQVLAACNRISFLALRKLISRKDVMEYAGYSMLRCWNNTENFIKARRKELKQPGVGGWGCYMCSFEQFITENRKELDKIPSPYQGEGDKGDRVT